MSGNALRGEQYVRLAAEATRAIGPYLHVPGDEIEELIVELEPWPVDVQPPPRPGRNGLLVAGDPLLLDANDAGLVFAARLPDQKILVPWTHVKSVHILPRSWRVGA